VYVVAFTVFGILVSFILHAMLEVWYIDLLREDYPTFSFGWSWGTWYTIHHVGTVLLLLLGVLSGYVQGRYWWRVLYLEGRYPKVLRRFGP